jgi:signal peptidase II
LWCIIVAIILLVDQFIKYLILNNVPLMQTKEVIPNVVNITHLPNTGAFFGIFANNNDILAIITFVIVCGFIIYLVMQSKNASRLLVVALSLIIGGALGNILDRVIHGAVVDYVTLKFLNFPTFNFADMCITSGAALLIIYVLKSAANESAMVDKSEAVLKTDDITDDLKELDAVAGSE